MRWRRGISLCILSWLLAAAVGSAATKLLGLRTSVDQRGTTFLLQVPTPVEYVPSRIGSRLLVLDLAGVFTDRSSDSQLLQSPLVSSYRLLNYQAADSRPHLRLEVLLKEEAEIHYEEAPEGLQVRLREGSATVAAEASPAAGTAIEEVSVVQAADDSLAVEIVADGAVEYRTLQLDNPSRLVVDIPNTVNRIRQKHLSVNTPPLRAVRIAQFSRSPLVSRVVLDLDSEIPFHIQPQSNTLVVWLNEAEPVEAGSLSAEEPTVSEPPTAETVADVIEQPSVPEELEASPAEEPVLLASNQPTMAVALEPQPSLTPAMVSPVTEPSELPLAAEAEPEAASFPAIPELPEPVAAPRAAQTPLSSGEAVASESALDSVEVLPETTPVAAEPAETVLLAQQTPPPSLTAAAAGQAAQVAAGPTYTGELISVNLKNVDLQDFFRLMHEISGLNIVLDPNVSGVVTIVLDEVPWDQAVDIVLKNNSLGKEVEGNVVRIATLATLQREEEQRVDLARAVEEGQPRVTVTRPVSYARAEDLIATLKRFLSARGDLIADARTNTLIITDIPGVIGNIDDLIATLDQKTQQVEIEARVVAASRSFARDIGTQLAASGLTGNVVLGGTGLVGVSPINRGLVPPLFIGTPPDDPGTFANVPQPLATNFPAVGATSGFTFLHTSPSGNFALDAIITAAESKGVGKLLSRPKVITQSNIEALVKQGVRIPLQTTVNNTVSVQFVDVVLRMTVTPQITADGTVFLTIDIENTTIDPGIARVNGIPALDTQQATTQVLVSNGGTVFFGGVIQNINNLTIQQVPLLGSIPLIGNLFKRKFTDSTTNELLFFITPKIIES